MTASPAAPAAGAGTGFWRLQIEEEVPSTSSLLIARAEAGEAEGAALMARRQSAGRGRSSRAWASPAGNLYLSVLLRPPTPARHAAQWGLLAGVALAEAAAEIAAHPDGLRLKWPNDLLLDGAKCAGILAESALAADGALAWLVLGMGVNLAHAPSLPDRPTATLGGAEPPEAFAARLLRRLAHWRGRYLAEGFAPVRQAWLDRGPALGSRITLRQGGKVSGGNAPAGDVLSTEEFAGLAADGSLLLRRDGVVRPLVAGEVERQG